MLLPGRIFVALTAPWRVPSGPRRRTVPLTAAIVLPALRSVSVSMRVEPVPTTFAAPAVMLYVGVAGLRRIAPTSR